MTSPVAPSPSATPATPAAPAGEFDVVIVGAGAAGAILAARLAEEPGLRICLLEAGPRDWHPWLHIPAGFIKMLFNPAFTWPFQTEATDWTNGRRIPVPQGRTLGGSTAINGLVYNRGLASDYDRWAALGNPGWGFADVLPYFRRTEAFAGGGDDALRGRAGPLPVTRTDWTHPLCDAFIAAAAELGLPRNDDYNGAHQAGAGYFQRTIAGGRRLAAEHGARLPAPGACAGQPAGAHPRAGAAGGDRGRARHRREGAPRRWRARACGSPARGHRLRRRH